MTDNFGQPMPQKSNTTRNWILIIGGIVVGLCCISALCVGGVFYAAVSAIRSSDVYQNALSEVTANPAVVEALGAPVEAGFMPSGNIETNNGTGTANFNISLTGSKQTGTLYVEASQRGASGWVFERLYVQTEDGQTIDITP